MKKLGKRPILKPASIDRIDDLCTTDLLECEKSSTKKVLINNKTTKVFKKMKKPKNSQNHHHEWYPSSWAPLLDVLKGEIWDVPILVAAGILACILIIFEISLLARTFRSKYASSRRHLFLGQVSITLLIAYSKSLFSVALNK